MSSEIIHYTDKFPASSYMSAIIVLLGKDNTEYSQLSSLSYTVDGLFESHSSAFEDNFSPSGQEKDVERLSQRMFGPHPR